jgi:sugar-specific transcriptional regulator TrmB
MDDADATDALEDLGLTRYEAQVFVGLQKLGIGSASDVADVVDVPRSQVYGAAEKLERRGLIDVQQSDPIQYRPVDLEEARRHLRNRYERREERAFEYLDTVRSEYTPDEHQEDIWTVTGRESIESRVRHLLDGADRSILYGVGADLLEDTTATSLEDRASQGVSVTVVSADEEVVDRFDRVGKIQSKRFPNDTDGARRQAGRVLVVDGETILLSIAGGSPASQRNAETAIWSTGTGFAAVIIRLLDTWMEKHVGL